MQRGVRVLAITSGKGGVGKTNVTVNLAHGLNKQGSKVTILDADFSLANVDLLLNVHPQYTLADVLSGEKELKDILIECTSGINLIPAASGVKNMANLSQAEYAGVINSFNNLEKEIDYLLVDTAAGISEDIASFCRASQEVIVVMCNEPTSINDSYALIKVFSKDYEINNFKLIINQANIEEAKELYKQFIAICDKYLQANIEFLGNLPDSTELKTAVKQKSSVINIFPEAEISKSFQNIAQKIAQMPVNNQANGFIQFFFERLISNS